jgi:hypothetical protein
LKRVAPRLVFYADNLSRVWRARRRDGTCGRRPFKKRTADFVAAFEKLGRPTSMKPQVEFIKKAQDLVPKYRTELLKP